MEESNLNLKNSGEVDKINKNIEVSDEIISNLSSEENLVGGNETLLNINDEETNEVLEKPKFSFSSLFGKKDKTVSDIQDFSLINNNNNTSSSDKDIHENIIVGPNTGDDKSSNVNIFQELGELNFLETQDEVNFEIKSEPIVLITKISSYLFYVILIFNVLFFLHIYIKSTDSDFVSYIPGACKYIGSSIDGYNNLDCKTFPKIIDDIEIKKSNLEISIISGLKKLIPIKINIDYILATPEVKFILDKKSKSNVLYTKILSEFELIRTNATGGYKGKNIICSNYSFDDKGVLTLTCDFLGAPILDEGQTGDVTSRTVAIDFLKQLQSKNSNFQVLNYPKIIEISKYNSIDGLLTIFKTKSTLTLNLKYNLSSK